MTARIARPPPMSTALEGAGPQILSRLVEIGATVNGRYLHWDEVRRRKPPEGLTLEQWWTGMRLTRQLAARPTGLMAKRGEPFTYSLVDPLLERLHHLDLRAAGRLAAPAAVVDRTTRDRYMVRGLIEEAISSSLLEGAATTRRAAKEMLRAGRQPRDRSERMIINNYRAIRRIGEAATQDLTPALLMELHAELTEGTLEEPADAGRFQQPGEGRVAVYDRDGDLVHQPPPAEEIPERIDRLCEFANDEHGPFTHPLVKAIMLHFWLAYVHPFVDGNGRTARALFYWYALRAGYWLVEFVSISKIILGAPAQYGRAFIHSETDDNDLTYFLLHQLDVLGRAFEELANYVDRTIKRTRAAEQAAGELPGLNHRQRALLGHALRKPGTRYTYQSHARSHNVSRQTARTDLLTLQNHGWLNYYKDSRQVVFTAPEDLAARLREGPASA